MNNAFQTAMKKSKQTSPSTLKALETVLGEHREANSRDIKGIQVDLKNLEKKLSGDIADIKGSQTVMSGDIAELRKEMNSKVDSLRHYIDEKTEESFRRTGVLIDEKTDESFRRTGALFEDIQDKLGIILEVFNPTIKKVENHEDRINSLEDELPTIRAALSIR